MRADYDWQNHLRKSFISLKKEMMQARGPWLSGGRCESQIFSLD